MEGALKSLNIRANTLAPRSNVMWDIQLATQLGPFLVDLSCLVLMENWNAVMDPSISGWGASKKTSDCSLVDLISKFGFVNRYQIDHPRQEM